MIIRNTWYEPYGSYDEIVLHTPGRPDIIINGLDGEDNIHDWITVDLFPLMDGYTQHKEENKNKRIYTFKVKYVDYFGILESIFSERNKTNLRSPNAYKISCNRGLRGLGFHLLEIDNNINRSFVIYDFSRFIRDVKKLYLKSVPNNPVETDSFAISANMVDLHSDVTYYKVKTKDQKILVGIPYLK